MRSGNRAPSLLNSTVDSKKKKAEPKSLNRIFGILIGLEGNKMAFTVLQKGGALKNMQGFSLDNRKGCVLGVMVNGN